MADFKAEARIPTRPLSYEYIDQAYNKELVIDYANGELYVKDAEGNVHNITQKVAEAVSGEIAKDPTIITEVIKITITDPETGEESEVSIDQAIVNNYTYITNVENTFNEYKETTDQKIENINDTLTNPDTGVIPKVDGLEESVNNTLDILTDPDTGLVGKMDKVEKDTIAFGTIIEVDESGNATLPAANITTDEGHQFVSQEQLNNINTITEKCEISYKTVVIKTTDWQGSEAPYTVTLNIPGITADMRPTLDLICSSYYETSEKEEDGFCIYKGVTGDGTVTLYNRVLPEVDLTVQFEIKSPFKVL